MAVREQQTKTFQLEYFGLKSIQNNLNWYQNGNNKNTYATTNNPQHVHSEIVVLHYIIKDSI